MSSRRARWTAALAGGAAVTLPLAIAAGLAPQALNGNPFAWGLVVAGVTAGWLRAPRLVACAAFAAAAIPAAAALGAPRQALGAAYLVLPALLAARALPRLSRWAGRGGFGARSAAVVVAIELALLIPWIASIRPPDGDEPYYLLVAHSLAYDGDVDLTNNYAAGDSLRFMPRQLEPQPGDPANGRYSRHAELLPLALAPAYRLAGRAGALAMMVVFAALLAAELWSALELDSRATTDRLGAVRRTSAFAAWAAVMLPLPMLPFATQIWVELPAALLCVVALRRARALASGSRYASESSRSQLVRLLAVGLLAALLLPLLKERLALLGAPLALLLIVVAPRRTRVWLFAAAAATAAGFVLWNLAHFATPLRMHTVGEFVSGRWNAAGTASAGLLADAAFGLVPAAPVWLLLPAGLWLYARRRRGEAAVLAAVSLLYTATVASRREWYGGWCPPFRYMVPLLPLAAPALALVWERARERRVTAALVACGVTWTAAIAGLYLLEPGLWVSFADGGPRWADAASSSLALDLRRLLASAARPNLALPVTVAAIVGLAVAVLLEPARASRRSRLLPPGPMVAGVVLATLLPAVALVAARLTPQRVVEWEDPHVLHAGGTESPPPFTPDRTQWRSGWELPPGESSQVRWLVGGGSPRDLVVTARGAAGSVLVVEVDRKPAGRIVPGPHWQAHRIVAALTPGLRELQLTVPETSAGAVVVDSARAE